MYLWVVLATFLAALAAYVLPLRGDMTSVVDTPVAQAMMMKMVVKHKAGLEYMKRNAWPYACPGGAVSQDQCKNNSMVSYNSGVIADNALDPYMPFGFTNDANYIDEIRCLHVTVNNGVPNYQAASNCNAGTVDTPVLRALLTYGPIPERWLTVDGNVVKPSGDLLTAMHKHFGGNQMAGYVVQRSSSNYIRNFEGKEFLIPSQFTSLNTACAGRACFAYISWR